jgi:hypothetical protein
MDAHGSAVHAYTVGEVAPALDQELAQR